MPVAYKPGEPRLPRMVVLGCSCGGIVVTSGDGRIVCSNTLDERLKISYQQNLPVVREQLFGAAEIVRG